MSGRPERLLPLALPGGCESIALLSEPTQLRSRVGVLVIVGGPQYRVGAHRQFVQLARALAAGGVPCLRFDHRGIGDCVAPLRSFEALDDDIDAAIGALLAARPELEGVVLWGLCDGAAAALLHVARRRDPRVKGLALLNPWVRNASSEAKAQVSHYYGARLRNPAFWAKLLKGGVSPRAVLEWWRTWRRARAAAPPAPLKDFRALMQEAWMAFPGPLLLQLALRDLTAQEFLQTAESDWPGWAQRPSLCRHDDAQADHTYSTSAARLRNEKELLAWLSTSFPAA